MAARDTFVRPLKRGLSPASGLDELAVPQSDWWTKASVGHHVVVVALIIAAAIHLPGGTKKLVFIIAMVVLGLGSSIVIDIVTRATGRLHYQMMWLDQLYVASALAIFPNWRATILMAGIAGLAAEGILFPPRTAAIGAAIGAAAFWGAMRFNQSTFWGPPIHGIIAYFFIGLAVAAAAATVSLARQRAEKNLLRFANLMEKIPVGIYVFLLDNSVPERGPIDPSSVTLLSSNPATISTTGLDISNLVGHTFADVEYEMPSAEEFFSLLRRVHRSGTPFKIDINIPSSDTEPGIKSGTYTLQVFSVGNR
ncbi:MAG TPA: hypothetical protein VMU77_07085, partial [Acidimicrobiales bacterium]|nr:hypothetical protein [Acidimicrobiales bacterium]